MELRIPTNDGVKIPDLCAWKEEQYIVCDVAIAAVEESQTEKFEAKNLMFMLVFPLSSILLSE